MEKLKFKKITLNENVFKLYNLINSTYCLNSEIFDMEKFYEIVENIDEQDEIKKIWYEIAIKLSNNLLQKLNYKIKLKKFNDSDKQKFIICDI